MRAIQAGVDLILEPEDLGETVEGILTASNLILETIVTQFKNMIENNENIKKKIMSKNAIHGNKIT